jgi:hypothetical protein
MMDLADIARATVWELKCALAAAAGAALLLCAASARADVATTFACDGTYEAQGSTGDPTSEPITGISVVIVGNQVYLGFRYGACAITQNTPNGISFTCPEPKLGGGWFLTTFGDLDRYTGKLIVNTMHTPPENSNRMGDSHAYVLTCKRADRIF